MRNIFLLYMPPSNEEAMQHYDATIRRPVGQARIMPYLREDGKRQVSHVFGDRPVAVWGSRDSERNRALFEKMTVGDDLLIVAGPTIKFMGKVALKTVNPELSRELWKNLTPDPRGWDLIYLIANPIPLDVPFVRFCELVGFSLNYQLQGFATVSAEKVEAFYSRYGDLYSVLSRENAGLPLAEIQPTMNIELPPVEEELVATTDETLRGDTPSEHVRMQWKLANLGIRTGAKVWVPVADQLKLRRSYAFSNFESEFAAGIDLPRSYVENIDVVWKDEFRIDAAFEIENTTSIYSGLLRFADLSILAPNTTYPMFIVAPGERRNRVREQLLRPSFKRLDLRKRVRFLPYEAVNDIDDFFPSSTSGLSVDVISGRAEFLI